MPSFDPKPFLDHAVLIETTEALEHFLEQSASANVIGVDTESAGFFKYKGIVNLIQICTPTQAALLDPQKVKDMTPLRHFAEQTSCEWIFHGGDYDAKALNRDFQVRVRKLFDTQIGAEILGLKELGLSALCERFLGFALDKKLQRCDWSRRPLTSGMQKYALLDAICLLPIREKLLQMIVEKDRLSWVQEECAQLVEEVRQIPTEKAASNPYAFFIKGARFLTLRSVAVLKEIWEEREHNAAELDRAAFMIVGNATLLDIARISPRTMAGLSVIKGMSEHFIHRFGRRFLEAVKRGLEADTTNLQPPSRSPRRQNFLSSWEGQMIGTLRDARNAVAAKYQLPGSLIASSETLEILSHDRPKNLEELIAHGALRRWQAQLLAESFLPILNQSPPVTSAKRRRRRPRPTPP